MRILIALVAMTAAAQTWPSQLSGLNSSPATLSSTVPAVPAAGASWVDTDRGITTRRLPNGSDTCAVEPWHSNWYFAPLEGVSYSGSYWMVPFASGVRAKANFTLTTSQATTSGAVLTFSATDTGGPTGEGVLRGSAHQFNVTGTNIPANTTVSSFDATTVTLSQSVSGTVASGATITFSNPPPLLPWVESTQAAVCRAGAMINSYSQVQSFNADHTILMEIRRAPKTGIVLYHVDGGTITFWKEIPKPAGLAGAAWEGIIGNNGSETWDHTNPNLIYTFTIFTEPPSLISLNVATEAASIVHSFTIGTGAQYDCPSGTYYVRNGGGGNQSRDDRYWTGYCQNSSPELYTRIWVYDKVLDQITAKKDITTLCGSADADIDWMGVSTLGNYVNIGWRTWGGYDPATLENWSHCHGNELFDRATLTSIGMTTSNNGHNDLGLDVNGFEVLASVEYDHRSQYDGDEIFNTVHLTKLSDVHAPPYTFATDYVKRFILPCSHWQTPSGNDPYVCDSNSSNDLAGINTHISGRGTEGLPGYFLYSFFSDSLQTSGVEVPGFARYENLAIRMDTTATPGTRAQFRRVGRNLGYRENYPSQRCTLDYFQEPHATVNRDFSMVLFNSSWMAQCMPTYGYTVYLGESSVPLTITTTSLPSGTIGAAYSQALTATGGAAPYSWAVTAGTQCGGLTLASNGTLSGTATTMQTCSFTVTVTDSVDATDYQALSITVSDQAAGSGRYVSGNVRITGKVQ